MLRFVSLCICLFALFASQSTLAAPSAMGLEKALDTVAGDGRPLSLSLQILLLTGLVDNIAVFGPDDDKLHPDHHCPVDFTSGTWAATNTAKSGAGWPCLIPQHFC